MKSTKTKKPVSPWSIRQMNEVALLTVNVPDKPVENDWEQHILLSSDWHWDNNHCDLKLLRRDLDAAVKKDAPIMAFGDLFCLMQGRYDPRRSRNGMRPSLDHDNYLDRVVNQSADWFSPYAKHLAFASRGNHEISNQRNNDTDVLERFCDRMKWQGSSVCTGGIGGWVFIRAKLNGKTQTLKLNFHHGAGGGGNVTKGVPKSMQRAAIFPDADIVVGGHIHQRWQLSITQDVISNKGNRGLKEQTHLCLPTYKQEYDPTGYDYHNLNERAPKPTGGCWLRLYYNQEGKLSYSPIFT